MNKADMEIGMEVWYADSYDVIRSGEVIEFPKYHPDYVKVRGTRDNYGTQGVKIHKCHRTEKELLAAMEAESNARFQTFCDEIKDVKDLVRFMYGHTVSCAEEYTDWDARRAAAARAKDLLGIDVDA